MFDRVIWDKLNEECGVFGIYNHKEASPLTYLGLHALQHRGQESAGICASDGERWYKHRGMGLVAEAFAGVDLQTFRGNIAIGHTRYTTAGSSKIENAQPLFFRYAHGSMAVAHNGNLVNASVLRKELEAKGSIFQTTSDTEVIAHLIARSKSSDLTEAVREALQHIKGAYALLVMNEKQLIIALDPNGLRPLSLGRLGDAICVASETCAFDIIGAEYWRDVQPGELIVVDEDGVRESTFAENTKRSICTFEYIYFARPDSDIDSINVHMARKRLGKQLALEAPVEADVVTGVPDSSISAAIGFAEATGIPYELGLIKNRYVGRTFIQPTQELRERGVYMKLSAVRKVVEGKRVVMIDDSIVRGTTSSRIVQMLRDAGAKEVHVRISSPPVMNSCFYGIDTSTRDELIASSKSVEEIRQFIGADSLSFLTIEGMIDAIGREDGSPNRGHCLACFNGDYPTEVEYEAALPADKC
ncbi:MULTISPECIES: amidophosphoribosyltransferase [Brevibacillus]|jgi:amidophosphoribosyltransferase|uniref:amidophosphoribosyltransferase n=1 Tax=Brevibacillus TaxID=55080 RepID=UPI00046A58BF|nr:amidophosphoribosyltransferase [Brevibacillus borstelensis]KKX56073.1 amidophosphoribosyltransferase [Brevibacillus borstelensis cifa_chp40]MBE5398404.1 amidophosphoribosyltransferase [Brevibacillus borstelensis]MCC0564839.1 amidophosphoribosyltransferase [Brevibacillus borstelensis]MCM3471092.1 amidophosphoribosyltransferase [Brevibacillus borstelensis]MCM3558273.1 amidophosphoribosyltransferase [Brevibacillus borstelensis]